MFQVTLLCFAFLPASFAVTLPGNIVSQINGAPSCGYQGLGSLVDITSSIQVCLPPVFCNPETCPPQLGQCVNGRCQYIGSYKGLATYPKAIATYYCELSTGGCNGALGGSVLDMATNAASSLNLQRCDVSSSGNCVGIAATSPMLMGNSQIAHVNGSTYVPLWGLGFTYASGLCYELTGPGGKVTVAMTDRCAGYCRCDGSKGSDQAAYHECGEQQCFDSPNFFPNTPCAGTLPQLGYNSCGSYGCPVPIQKCDWCASNSHPHFDVDIKAYNRLCGSAGANGHCEISAVRPVVCDVGQTPPSPTGGNNAAAAPANAFNCNGISPSSAQPLIPGSSFCCNWGFSVSSTGACVSGGSSSGSGSGSSNSGSVPANAFNCNGVAPSSAQPLIPGTSFCCNWGFSVSSTGACVSGGSSSGSGSGSSSGSGSGSGSGSSSGSSGVAPANSFNCNGVSPNAAQPRIPGTLYCCYWGFRVSASGACVM